jgi:hypothetical protein
MLRLFGQFGIRPAFIAKTSVLKATRLTMENIDFDARGELELHDSLINGKPTNEGAHGGDVTALMKLAP